MLTARIDQQSKRLIVGYPGYSKKKESTISVRNYDEAAQVFQSRLMKFICAELQSFINMRQFAYNNSRTMFKAREQAIQNIQFIIDSYSTGDILRLAKHVSNARVSFSLLMPSKPSPALTHFDTHIIPIIKYCTDYYSKLT
ncbi:hypothetical protein HP439_13065 [Sphingobacterium shayense]|uniref:hypothetical protein n=1 Tax=Sphingobacterium shayense TaxID=626343 RepID=UPI001552B0F1|nr:hypothetical protein [Sphingobacterium shayense]NQD71653.1 hypothetical protein [Sphingobacterium shayense]